MGVLGMGFEEWEFEYWDRLFGNSSVKLPSSATMFDAPQSLAVRNTAKVGYTSGRVQSEV